MQPSPQQKPLDRWIPLGLALLSALVATVAQASEPSLGERLALEGRCTSALPQLAAERAESPSPARLWLRSGECLTRLGRYDEALTALQEARRADPDLMGVDLRLGVAWYHFEDFDRAEEALARAEAKDPARAELSLYQGLILLRRTQPGEAATYLERARTLSAEQVDPVASYHAGLARGAAGDREQAEAHLERVIRDWPGTDWAEQAQLALDGLDSGGVPGWAVVRMGIEFDDNVILRGDQITLGDEISDDSGQRAVWGLDVGVPVFDVGPWSGGVSLAYEGTAHFENDLDDFDYQYPAAGVWVDHRLLSSTTIRGLVDFGYAWVDGDDFLAETRARAAVYHQWARAGATGVFYEQVWDKYFTSSDDVVDGPGAEGLPCPPTATQGFCGPPGLNEEHERNRDGQGFVIGLDHSVPIPSLAPLDDWLRVPSLLVGYRYQRFDSRGREYSFEAHEVQLTGSIGLPLGFDAFAFASYAYRPYRHPTTFPDESNVEKNAGAEYGLPGGRRREQEVQVEVALERAITSWLRFSGSYRYTRNYSTSDVFDYRREIFGLELRASFGG